MGCAACLFLRFLDFLSQRRQRLGQTADSVDQTEIDSLLTVDDGAYIGGNLIGAQKKLAEFFFRDGGMVGDKFCDAVLHTFEVVISLRDADYGPADADGVNGHRR